MSLFELSFCLLIKLLNIGIMLQQCHSLSSVLYSVQLLFEAIEAYIDQKQTVMQLPKFLTNITTKFIFQINYPVAISQDTSICLVEQQCSSVPKIQKDNLTPKDVERQKQDNQSLAPKQSTLNVRQLSTQTKKNSTSNSRTMKSVSLASRRSIKETKINETACTILPMEQNEQDYDIMRLRQKTEARIKYNMQFQRLSLCREKSFRQKSKMLEELVRQQHQESITHDYEGELIKRQIGDDKIKHYSVHAQFGTLVRMKKQQQFNNPIQMNIQINKNKQKEHANRQVKPMQMPLFPVEQKDHSLLHEIKNYKLHDYKKHFGRKYSRIDQYSETLEVSKLTKKEEHNDQIFSERRHLRDSSVLQTSREINEPRGLTRRLALPRLHGRYKVLDRYDQV